LVAGSGLIRRSSYTESDRLTPSWIAALQRATASSSRLSTSIRSNRSRTYATRVANGAWSRIPFTSPNSGGGWLAAVAVVIVLACMLCGTAMMSLRTRRCHCSKTLISS